MKHAVTQALVFEACKDPEFGILKIRVTYKRDKRPYTTGIKVARTTWNRLKNMGPFLDNRVKDEEFIKIHQAIYGYVNHRNERVEGYMGMYRNVIHHLGATFSFAALKYRIEYYGRIDPDLKTRRDVFKALERKKEDLYASDRIGSAGHYQVLGTSLRRFLQSLRRDQRFALKLEAVKKGEEIPLSFTDITVRFLEEYERWMLHSGKASQKPGEKPGPAAITTIGIYLRTLRCLINDAISDNTIDRSCYPFGRRLFVISNGNKPKKALSRRDLDAIKAYQPENDAERRAHDLWLFTFYCSGINMADICKLRWSDIDDSGEYFTFIRKKTQRATKANIKTIRVYLRPEAWAAIDRWGNPGRVGAHVFPFFNEVKSAKDEKSATSLIIQHTNKWMKRIAEKLGITSNLVTYVARHSYGTTLLRGGVPLKFISDSYGHTSITTTENYMGLFEEEEIKKYMQLL